MWHVTRQILAGLGDLVFHPRRLEAKATRTEAIAST